MSPRVVLVGAPGSGKTAVGELVATRLGIGFRDTDQDVEATTGRTVSDLFVEEGEQHFRRLEAAAVRAAVAEHDGVLSIGGGAVLDPEIRGLLQHQRVVYLEVGLAAAAERVGLARSRPLLVVNPRAELKRLLEQRRSIYEALATHVVRTDDRPLEAVADEVVGLLEKP